MFLYHNFSYGFLQQYQVTCSLYSDAIQSICCFFILIGSVIDADIPILFRSPLEYQLFDLLCITTRFCQQTVDLDSQLSLGYALRQR